MAKAGQAKYASAVLAALGVAALALWLLTGDGSATSMLLLLSGIGVVVLAILLYFFSPYRYLRAEVGGAMVMSDTLSLNRILTSLLVNTRGVHIPASQAGLPKLFLPLSGTLGTGQLSALKSGDAVFEVSGDTKGIALLPPGRSLFTYVQSIGASFSEEGVDNEIKDVLESGLELVSKASVTRENGHVVVSMQGLAVADMCAAMRREDPGICTRTSCPICSFIACMVAEGTGKKVMVESVKTESRAIIVTYELV